MFQTKFVEKIEKHILCSVTFFENRAVCEVMWNQGGHRLKYGACAFHPEYLRLQTHTFGICHIYCFSTATTLLNVTLYVHCMSCLR